MDRIIQRLQVESLNNQISLLQMGRAYLAQKSTSPDSMDEEAIEILWLMEQARQENGVLRGELRLIQGKVKPVWG
jgi:hypothetical protein